MLSKDFYSMERDIYQGRVLREFYTCRLCGSKITIDWSNGGRPIGDDGSNQLIEHLTLLHSLEERKLFQESMIVGK